MRTPKPTDKRAVIEALLRGNLKPLEQFKQTKKGWIQVMANPPILDGNGESPDDLFTSVTVHPGTGEPIPALTRREFTDLCEELSKSHNLFVIT